MSLTKLLLVQGDVLPVPFAILTDILGNPLNLGNPGTTVRFRMVNVYTGEVAVDAPARILQNNSNLATYGQVSYYWAPSDTSNPGLYQAWFIYGTANGPQHFPPDDSYYIKVRASH